MPGRRFSAFETQLKSQSFSEISAAYTAPFLPHSLNGLFILNQFGFFFPPRPRFVLAIHYCAASSDSPPHRVLFMPLCRCHIRSYLANSLLHQRWPSGPHCHPTARRLPVQFPPGGLSEWDLHVHSVPLPKSQRRARRGNLDSVAVCNVMATGPWCRRAFDPRQLGYDPERRVSRE